MSSGSSTTGNILGAIGAVVGGIFGGPVGAAQGYAIGSSIGNAIDPPKGPSQEGPRLQDKSVQTSTYGATIPRIYGTCKVAGNIFWLEGDQLKEVAKKKKSGGKGGGGGTEIKTYTYYATFAVGLCQGQIAGVRRIWAGPNLIYDAQSDDLETIIAGNRNIANIEIYTGSDSQLPSARIQADKGLENTPAYTGLAYLLVKDFELTNYGNSLAQAQFQVEIVRSANDAPETLFSVSPDNTGTQFLIVGRPREYNSGLCIGATGAGLSRFYTVTKSGQFNPDYSAPIGSFSGWQLPSNLNESLGSFDFVMTSATTGTKDMLVKKGAAYESVSTGFDTANTRLYERAGHVWIGFTSDAENPGSSTSGNWVAKVSDSGTDIAWAYASRFDAGPLGSSFVASPDGKLVRWFAQIPQGLAGPLALYVYDESGASIGTEVFNITARAGYVSNNSSSAYIDDRGKMHMLFELYGTPSPIPSEYGKFYYVRVDVQSLELEYQGEIFFSNLVSLGHVSPQKAYESDGVLYFGSIKNDKAVYASFSHSRIAENAVPLSAIVSAECLESGLITAPDINAASISTDSVAGYKVASAGSIRGAIEPLRGAWPFDVLQDGYAVKFQRRGTSSVATIDAGLLGVNEQIREAREMDSQIARKVVVKYLDKARDYDVNEQAMQRENTEAVNTLTLDLPVVLSATEAKRVAEKLLYLYWLDRSDFTFKLPPEYHYLQPADVVTVNGDGVQYELLIRRIVYNQDGSLDCTAKPNAASIYTSIADADGGLIPPVTIPLPGDSIGLLLDIPVIDETLQNTTGYVGYMTGETSGWPGGVYWITNDNGQTWADLQGFVGKGTFGATRDTLPANSGLLIQLGGSLTVDLYSGELESITLPQMLNGKNYAAYGSAGRWEIIRFQNAVLNADGSYTLSGFIRGDRGTEWATGLHQAGDMFCLLDDPDGAFIFTNTASIGVPRTLRAVTAGADIDSAANETFTYNGVNLECYSPVHAKGLRDGSSNLAISWIRRTRIGGEWRSNVDASLGEATEAYEIDVMDGATVKRTINSATQSATYTSADQTTDFGAPQSSVTVRIYQMSATVGRGYPLEVTL